jgi:hypothetical protein
MPPAEPINVSAGSSETTAFLAREPSASRTFPDTLTTFSFLSAMSRPESSCQTWTSILMA